MYQVHLQVELVHIPCAQGIHNEVLMTTHSLPSFSTIDVAAFPSKLDTMLAIHLQKIADILTNNKVYTWDNLMRPLDEMDDELEKFWSPLSHLHAVVNSKALRECYQACLPKLSAYSASVGQNQALYDAVKSLEYSKLNPVQCKIVDDAVRDFKLSGVALSLKDKSRFEEISTKLSQLSNKFENNILDATEDFHLHITDKEQVAGLPEHALATASALSNEKNLSGWMLTLDSPSYIAVMTYADDRQLRETLYGAYVTRASDVGPSAKKFDNTEPMNEILALRHESAKLLGFANYAELSLATKMATSTTEVNTFLADLAKRARPQAGVEFKELEKFAFEHYGIEVIEPWDVTYLSEKKQHLAFNISQEMLRPYFPLDKVLDGMFSIVNKLYGMTFKSIKDVDTWHKDVTCYAIYDEKDSIRGYIYFDLFARLQKRGGAWMDSCQTRFKRSDGVVQTPIAMLTCNFAKASANKPPMLSHDEVQTLFHELGHCLHHVLTQVEYMSASGIHGVEWDAVELPSQFFENWCWEEQAINLLTKHVDNGEPMPAELFNQLVAAKNFQSAMVMMRQLEFSIFDFRIHEEYIAQDPSFISQIIADVRKSTAVVPIVDYNRFQHSFSHIFAGGYAAGYYSYKWAEVLSSDAFSRFEEEGVFNLQTGRDFLHSILEVGGSCKALSAFVSFRKRKPTVDALLRHNGIF